MEFIKKYLLFAFLLENIIVQTRLLSWLSEYLFIPFLAVGAFCMLSPSFWSRENLGKFRWLYLLMMLYVGYEFTIGIQYIDGKTLLYTLSKIVTFGIIITSVSCNASFYRSKAVYWLVIAMAFFMFYSMLSGDVIHPVNGRMQAGFTNANTAGSMGALTVGFVLFYMKGRRWNLLTVLIILVGFYGILAGGSRAGFLMLLMLIFFRFGINYKTVTLVGLLIITGLYILPAMNIHTVGLQRMLDTYNGIEGTNREFEREAAEWMIAQKPWTGWGYAVQNVGYAARLTMMGSHNGYLEIIKQMGFPCAILYFAILLITIVKALFNRQYRRHGIDLFLSLSIMLVVSANYESLFIGVHEYNTNLFFIALALVSARYYGIKQKTLSHD